MHVLLRNYECSFLVIYASRDQIKIMYHNEKKVYPALKGRIEYITILKLVLDSFVINCKNRTRKKAALKYWRNKPSFSVHGEIQFNGKNVLQKSDLNSVVK